MVAALSMRTKIIALPYINQPTVPLKQTFSPLLQKNVFRACLKSYSVKDYYNTNVNMGPAAGTTHELTTYGT